MGFFDAKVSIIVVWHVSYVYIGIDKEERGLVPDDEAPIDEFRDYYYCVTFTEEMRFVICH